MEKSIIDEFSQHDSTGAEATLGDVLDVQVEENKCKFNFQMSNKSYTDKLNTIYKLSHRYITGTMEIKLYCEMQMF